MPSPLKLVLLLLLLNPLAGCGGGESRSPEEHIAAAQDSIDRDKPEFALIELKNALLQAPDNVLARRLLGETHLALGDGPSAQKELEQAAAQGVDPAYIQPLLARALLMQQDYEGVLEINPYQDNLSPTGKASVHATRGMALLATDKLDEAGEEFEKGLGQDAQSVEVLTGMAWLAGTRQELDPARALLDQVFAIDPGHAEAWSLLGTIERTQGNLEAALDAFSKAVDNRHANTLDRMNRISIHMALGNLDPARTEIAAQRNQGVRNHLLDYLEGLLAYQEKRYKDAQGFFEQTLAANPQHVRALYYAGASMLMTGNLEQANSYLQRFDSKNPGFGPALKMLAWIAIQNENYKDTERFIRPVLAQEPGDTYSLKLLASALAGEKRHVESLEVMQQWVEQDPESAEARIKLGIGMIQEGELESGLRELESARKLDPVIQQTSLAIIFTYLKNKELDKALEAALQLRDTHPDSVVANAALGTVYISRQEHDKAGQAFRDTLALDSNNVTANSGLASLAVQAGRPEEAKTYYRKILEHQPGSLTTSMNLAYLSALDGNVDEMRTVLAQAIETSPQALLPRLALSRHYTRQAEYAKVVEILAPVHQSGKGSFEYLKILTEAQYRTDDSVSARDNLRLMVDMAPNNASVHYLLAMTLRKLDDTTGSRHALERVLALDPDHAGARQLWIEQLIAAGDTPAARKHIDLLRKQSGETAEVFLLEGRLASSLGNHKIAATAYRRAFELKETNFNLLKLEAATWDSGDREAAIGLLTAWLDKLPADPLSSLRLASRYVAMDRKSDAIEIYTRMLEAKPDNAVVLNDLAWLLQDSDPKQALAYAEKAHSVAPRSHAVTDTLAVVVSKSDPSRAQLLIREALRASPGNPGYRYHQALIYQRADNPEQALRVVKELLEDTSDFPKVEEARQLMQELGG